MLWRKDGVWRTGRIASGVTTMFIPWTAPPPSRTADRFPFQHEPFVPPMFCPFLYQASFGIQPFLMKNFCSFVTALVTDLAAQLPVAHLYTVPVSCALPGACCVLADAMGKYLPQTPCAPAKTPALRLTWVTWRWNRANYPPSCWSVAWLTRAVTSGREKTFSIKRKKALWKEYCSLVSKMLICREAEKPQNLIC